MTKKKERPIFKFKLGDAIKKQTDEQTDLPPITDDNLEETNADEYAQYLHDFETEPTGQTDNIEQISIEHELIDQDNNESWLDDGLDEKRNIEVLMDEEEPGWSSINESKKLEIEDNWFDEEDDNLTLDVHKDDDSGDDGPVVEDVFNIDKSSWENLDDLPVDFDETIDKTMKRLGISLALDGIIADSNDIDQPVDKNYDVQFLGPINGNTSSVALVKGKPIAVGDGVFAKAADGLLHKLDFISEITGLSVCSHKHYSFIGTTKNGAIRVDLNNKSVAPINGSVTIGIDKSYKSNTILTSFNIAGCAKNSEYLLIGHTDEGLVYSSKDYGDTWTGPIINEKCLAIYVQNSSPNSKLGNLCICTKENILFNIEGPEEWNWQSISLPIDHIEAMVNCHISFCAAGDTILVAAQKSFIPLLLSLDKGVSWRYAESIKGVTAVAVDAEDPSWLAVAIYRKKNNAGFVCISQDGGITWKTILATGRKKNKNNQQENTNFENVDSGRINKLLINRDNKRELFVVANEGVHLIILPQNETTH